MDAYELLELLGVGTTGSAHKVRRRADGQIFVVKRIQLAERSPVQRHEMAQEIQCMRSVRHPAIIEYVDSFVEGEVLHIVMEFADGGDIAQLLKERTQPRVKQDDTGVGGQTEKLKAFDESFIWRVVIQVVSGLEALHAARILHRDIKGANIFTASNGRVKIGDFGLGRLLDADCPLASTTVGTPLYFSPEMCEERPYDQRSDIWALGCLIYEMATLQPPFVASSQSELTRKILHTPAPTLPPHFSMELAFLAAKMLEKDSSVRPSATQILEYAPVRQRLPQIHAIMGIANSDASACEDHADGYRSISSPPFKNHVVQRPHSSAMSTTKQTARCRSSRRTYPRSDLLPSTEVHIPPVEAGNNCDAWTSQKSSYPGASSQRHLHPVGDVTGVCGHPAETESPRSSNGALAATRSCTDRSKIHDLQSASSASLFYRSPSIRSETDRLKSRAPDGKCSRDDGLITNAPDLPIQAPLQQPPVPDGGACVVSRRSCASVETFSSGQSHVSMGQSARPGIQPYETEFLREELRRQYEEGRALRRQCAIYKSKTKILSRELAATRLELSTVQDELDRERGVSQADAKLLESLRAEKDDLLRQMEAQGASQATVISQLARAERIVPLLMAQCEELQEAAARAGEMASRVCSKIADSELGLVAIPAGHTSRAKVPESGSGSDARTNWITPPRASGPFGSSDGLASCGYSPGLFARCADQVTSNRSESSARSGSAPPGPERLETPTSPLAALVGEPCANALSSVARAAAAMSATTSSPRSDSGKLVVSPSLASPMPSPLLQPRGEAILIGECTSSGPFNLPSSDAERTSCHEKLPVHAPGSARPMFGVGAMHVANSRQIPQRAPPISGCDKAEPTAEALSCIPHLWGSDVSVATQNLRGKAAGSFPHASDSGSAMSFGRCVDGLAAASSVASASSPCHTPGSCSHAVSGEPSSSDCIKHVSSPRGSLSPHAIASMSSGSSPIVLPTASSACAPAPACAKFAASCTTSPLQRHSMSPERQEFRGSAQQRQARSLRRSAHRLDPHRRSSSLPRSAPSTAPPTPVRTANPDGSLKHHLPQLLAPAHWLPHTESSSIPSLGVLYAWRKGGLILPSSVRAAGGSFAALPWLHSGCVWLNRQRATCIQGALALSLLVRMQHTSEATARHEHSSECIKLLRSMRIRFRHDTLLRPIRTPTALLLPNSDALSNRCSEDAASRPGQLFARRGGPSARHGSNWFLVDLPPSVTRLREVVEFSLDFDEPHLVEEVFATSHSPPLVRMAIMHARNEAQRARLPAAHPSSSSCSSIARTSMSGETVVSAPSSMVSDEPRCRRTPSQTAGPAYLHQPQLIGPEEDALPKIDHSASEISVSLFSPLPPSLCSWNARQGTESLSIDVTNADSCCIQAQGEHSSSAERSALPPYGETHSVKYEHQSHQVKTPSAPSHDATGKGADVRDACTTLRTYAEQKHRAGASIGLNNSVPVAIVRLSQPPSLEASNRRLASQHSAIVDKSHELSEASNNCKAVTVQGRLAHATTSTADVDVPATMPRDGTTPSLPSVSMTTLPSVVRRLDFAEAALAKAGTGAVAPMGREVLPTSEAVCEERAMPCELSSHVRCNGALEKPPFPQNGAGQLLQTSPVMTEEEERRMIVEELRRLRACAKEEELVRACAMSA